MTKFTRKQIWRHNGFLGSARMAHSFTINVQDYPTTTDASRRLARKAEYILGQLEQSLKIRRDQVQ